MGWYAFEMLTLIAASTLLVSRPKLVVILSIDQFRSDYLYRYEKFYLPPTSKNGVGGFKYLLQNGANFVNASYSHLPTSTGPGHAIIGTGSTPGINGIVANEWYDRANAKRVYCVEDPNSKDVLTGKPGMSPKNLQVNTISDELELATNGKSITVSIAVKDRASILMAGHTADDVIWFDKISGHWTTSDYYEKSMRLPKWVEKVNSMKIPDKMRGKTWNQSLPNSAYENSFYTKAPSAPAGFGDKFPHTLGDDANFYDRWTYTPFCNDFVVETAENAITELSIGSDEIPDVMTINFSSNDYLGHRFGPYSPQVTEMSIATDKSISRLLNFLDKNVKGGLDSVLFVVTADHGVVPIPEDLTERQIPAARTGANFVTELKQKTEQAIGVDCIAHVDDGLVWFDISKLSEKKVELEVAQRAVSKILSSSPLVYRSYAACDLLTLANGDRLDIAAKTSFNQERGGDVVMILKPFVYESSSTGGTGHGTAWIYDRSVPLIFCGDEMEKGNLLDDAGPKDIAATVCFRLGIIAPGGSVGKVIGISRN